MDEKRLGNDRMTNMCIRRQQRIILKEIQKLLACIQDATCSASETWAIRNKIWIIERVRISELKYGPERVRKNIQY